jgi:hypothetical protein
MTRTNKMKQYLLLHKRLRQIVRLGWQTLALQLVQLDILQNLQAIKCYVIFHVWRFGLLLSNIIDEK